MPGITQNGCNGGPVYIPNSTPMFNTGAIRTFVDCNSDPFNFYDGIRNLFFVLEAYAPEVNNFLLTTDLVLFSWIRSVGFVNSAIYFPFESGQIPDVWYSCFESTSPNFWNLLIVILLLAFLIIVFILLAITVFVLIADIFFAFIIILTEIIGTASGSYTLAGSKYNVTVANNYGNPQAIPANKTKEQKTKFIDSTKAKKNE